MAQVKANKRLGQHFLRDPEVIEKMISVISPRRNEPVIEIGPGQGALTDALLQEGVVLHAVEVDVNLVARLRARYEGCKKLHIYESSALTFDYLPLVSSESMRLVGNLPYNISTPLLLLYLKMSPHFSDMHFCLQKEFAQRLCSRPGERNWSRLGATRMLYCDAELLFDIPAAAFNPQPKVCSSFVRLRASREPMSSQFAERMEKLVSKSFMHPRKNIRNIFAGMLDAEELESLGLNPASRPMMLTLEALEAILNRMDAKKHETRDN